MFDYFGGLDSLPMAKHMKSRAINAENPTGKKGKGGRAVSPLGPSRKGSPCLKDIPSGETVTLAEIEGPGVIQHIWITVDNKTSDADCFVLRDLVLRMYWDGEETPSVETPLGDFWNVSSIPFPSRSLRTGALTVIFRCRFAERQRSRWRISTLIQSRRSSTRLITDLWILCRKIPCTSMPSGDGRSSQKREKIM